MLWTESQEGVIPMTKYFPGLLIAMAIFLGADSCVAQDGILVLNQSSKPDSNGSTSETTSERSNLTKAEGIVMLDYQVIPLPENKSIDLMGFHFLNKMNDWLYLGIGGYAPLFQGEYGGFMAVDVTAHVQRRLFGNFFTDAGVSMGGGGGGKSVEQSKILSGTGGFVKSYLGLGYDFQDFSAGLNFAKMKFKKSALDNSQFNIYLQVPFSYAAGSYANSGERVPAADKSDTEGRLVDFSENMLTLGLDNFRQINPEGLNKDTINAADLQFSHFMTKSGYWYVNAGVGYRGLPLYNQILGGVGYRFSISSRISIYSQLAFGSGGYAPETINTGPGLLLYPKVSSEYMFDKNLGFSLSAGYLFAPRGSSKNYTFGASLNYHIYSGDSRSSENDSAESIFFRGYRVNLFQKTEFNVRDRGIYRSKINLLSVQLDNIVNDNIYVPVQISVAYNAYLGYPGYGEILAGVGVQNKYYKGDQLQYFGQFLVGTNSHGLIFKTGMGLNFGFNDRLAVYGLVGQTFANDREKFRSDYAGFGMTYRFSVPSW